LPVLALAQDTSVIRVVALRHSGTYPGIGQQVKWGLDLAAAQLDASGGILGRKLELIYEDEAGNPAVAVEGGNTISEVDDVLTGPVDSGSTPSPLGRWPSAMLV